jgi:hypothetical protein
MVTAWAAIYVDDIGSRDFSRDVGWLGSVGSGPMNAIASFDGRLGCVELTQIE